MMFLFNKPSSSSRAPEASLEKHQACSRSGSVACVDLSAAGKDPRRVKAEAKQKRLQDRRNTFDV
jgi:hypothetical protein